MLTSRGKHLLRYYPQHMILLSLVISTILGTLLLALPYAHVQYISWIDLFFTATSLTTATGMMTVPINHFSNFGHIIMLCLMQLGGLGLITLSLCFIYMFSNLGIYTQVVASEILSLKSFKDTKQTLFFIIKLTAITECIGACILFPSMYQQFPLKRAIFMSIFHSVSSFCNAGFSLLSNERITFNQDPLMIYSTIILMIIGGLGFVTWHELINTYWQSGHRTISWHTKLVLRMFFFTSFISATLFWLLENNNTLAHMTIFQKFSVSLFTSIALKSTGFVLVSFATVHIATLMLGMISMFIGSAPLSTGSGIKTSVFSIYLSIIKAAILGKRHAILYGRHVVDEQVYKATSIVALSSFWIILITFCLLIIEPHWKFIDILFQTISAFSNCGIIITSMSNLSIFGKLLIICSMIVGKIGALALILSIRRMSDLREITYPKEHVILG